MLFFGVFFAELLPEVQKFLLVLQIKRGSSLTVLATACFLFLQSLHFLASKIIFLNTGDLAKAAIPFPLLVRL